MRNCGQIRIRVCGILLNEKKEVLLVNHVKKGRSYWLFPGGGVEYGESADTALKREFMEELSLKIQVKNFVFVNETIYPGGRRHILNLYFRVTAKKPDNFRVNPDRVIKNAEFTGIKKFAKKRFYPDLKSDIIALWLKGFKGTAGHIKSKWKN